MPEDVRRDPARAAGGFLRVWTRVGIVNTALVGLGLLEYGLIGSGRGGLLGGGAILGGILGTLFAPLGLTLALAGAAGAARARVVRALPWHGAPLLSIPIFGVLLEYGIVVTA